MSPTKIIAVLAISVVAANRLALAAGTAQAQKGQAQTAQAPANPKPSAGSEFRAADGSFSCRIPGGWKAGAMQIGGTTVHFFQPEAGGDERIIVSALPSTADNLEELAQQGIALVTQQLFPGSRLVAAPKITQAGSDQVAEMTYVVGLRQAIWWHGLMLKNGTALGVLGGARSDRAQFMEQQCREVLQSMQPGKGLAGAQPAAGASGTGLAAAIIGQWTFFDRSGLTKGTVSKQITFHPNGRFDYMAATFIPDAPPDVDPTTHISGTYQLKGNIIIGRADNGQQATYTLELVPGGGLKINGELFIREK